MQKGVEGYSKVRNCYLVIFLKQTPMAMFYQMKLTSHLPNPN